MNNTQYFEEKIATLPEALQFAINRSDWKEVINNIQKEYKLHLDQGQILESVVMRLMFGDIDAPTFINILFSEGHISSQIGADILLEVDLKLLKEIRDSVGTYTREQEQNNSLDNILKTDEEVDAEERALIYANYYKEMGDTLKEVQTKIIAGTEFTDEEVAREMGISVEEYRRQSLTPSTKEVEIPEDISKEKEELLRELESPQKSFIKPLSQNIETYPTPAIQEEDSTPIPPDHQLKNTHIEEPYKEPEILIEIEKALSTDSEKPATQVEVKQAAPVVPQIKKPTTINLTNDAYREPIE